MTSQSLHFYRRGLRVEVMNVPPTRTLLQLIREDLKACGTKEGCNEGDCGACTVVLGETDAKGRLQLKAVNSCIRLAHSVNGLHLWTVEDIGTPEALHPCQQAMVACHGSQCGFCTPGFVMSLFAMYETRVRSGQSITREVAQEDLSGNLCRCTGYRPILDAAQRMASYPSPTPPMLLKSEHSAYIPCAQTANLPLKNQTNQRYHRPDRLSELLRLRAAHPRAQIVAGTTDVGLWINKGHQQFDELLDVTRVAELRRVERYPHHIAIGAAVTLHEAFDALIKDRPQLRDFSLRFAGLSVRNSGTLGGNVANGSPIGDSMPLLIALGANIVLMSQRKGQTVSRDMRLEDFYTGYRQNVLAKDEVLAWIKVPLPAKREFSRVYKLSKRYDDDISAVCLAVSLHLDGSRIDKLSIGVGGVAATPVRARKTEQLAHSAIWCRHRFEALKESLQAEFSPISDMRASGEYRRAMIGALFERFWMESQGEPVIRLESLGAAKQLEALS
jgi:xanthine dehydrogenase small subunit